MIPMLRTLPLGLAAALLFGPAAICAGGARSQVEDASQLPLPPVIPRSLIYESWSFYKQRFIQNDGRVIDHKAQSISTSEGQSYGLLRAVWLDDRETFQKVLSWTEANLRVGARNDRLYAWKWGQTQEGAWGVLDATSAADGDILIAYALLVAAERWRHAPYKALALGILEDLWALDVKDVKGRPILLPGDWAHESTTAYRLNPSYYMPFAFRAFATVDPTRPWASLVDTSYAVFEACRSKVGLPTDWCEISIETGAITHNTNVYRSTGDFGYEAFRVPWILAADYRWYGETRALKGIRAMDWLLRYWIVRRELPQVVTVDGIPRNPYPYLGMYGAVLPAIALLDPLEADILYQKALTPTYNAGLWGEPEDYYLQNWVWFGLALQSPIPPPVFTEALKR